jgi:carbon starvation protein CstA
VTEARKLTIAILWAAVIVTALFGWVISRLWMLSGLLFIVSIVATLAGLRSSRDRTRSPDLGA